MSVKRLSATGLRQLPRSLSRREFVRRAGGAVAAGAAVSGGLLRSPLLFASPRSNADPLPIPGGSPALGGGFHVYGPTPDGSFDPIDAEPATITNFNGVVGLAYISGTVSRRKIDSNVQVELPYIASDMRFMQGVYRGVDGEPRRGTFGFI
jgi:hypothetical protein